MKLRNFKEFFWIANSRTGTNFTGRHTPADCV